MSNYRPTRPQHRAKAHDEAHTEDAAHDPADDAPHPLIYRGEAKLIGTQDALVALLARLRAAGSFAYDSEFIGELTYLPKLCLIQVATTQEITLIDPIAKIDLTPFWELVADPSVEKNFLYLLGEACHLGGDLPSAQTYFDRLASHYPEFRNLRAYLEVFDFRNVINLRS